MWSKSIKTEPSNNGPVCPRYFPSSSADNIWVVGNISKLKFYRLINVRNFLVQAGNINLQAFLDRI